MRLITALLAFAGSAAAAGVAIVYNNSTKTIYAWSVGSTVGPRQKISPGGIYWEDMRRDEKTGGIAIKMTKGPDGLYNGEPQQVFAYNLDGATVWYDLSTVFGEPFIGERIEVTSTTGAPIVWPKGTHPGGSQVKSAPSSENVWFTVYRK